MTTPEYVRAVELDRERLARHDHLARVAACVRACCNPSLTARLSRALHLAPTSC